MRMGDFRGNWITSIRSGPWSMRQPEFANDRRLGATLGEREAPTIEAPTLVICSTAHRAVDVQSRKVRGSAFTEHGSSRSMALAITSLRATGDSLVAEFVSEHGPTAASTDEGRYMPSAAWARATESGLMYST